MGCLKLSYYNEQETLDTFRKNLKVVYAKRGFSEKKGLNYSTFGSNMRQFEGSYRYGFQGQEKENDIVEGGFAFKYRIQDSRIGRFLSVDPLQRNYSWNSTYAFAENRVIDGTELEGLEYLHNSAMKWKVYHGETTIEKRTAITQTDFLKKNYPYMYLGILYSGIPIQPSGDPKAGGFAIEYNTITKKIGVITHSWVYGYTKKNGTVVKGHARRLPKPKTKFGLFLRGTPGSSSSGTWLDVMLLAFDYSMTLKKIQAQDEFRDFQKNEINYIDKVKEIMAAAYFMNVIPQELFLNSENNANISNMLLSEDETPSSGTNLIAFNYLWKNRDALINYDFKSLEGKNPLKRSSGDWISGFSSNINQTNNALHKTFGNQSEKSIFKTFRKGLSSGK